MGTGAPTVARYANPVAAPRPEDSESAALGDYNFGFSFMPAYDEEETQEILADAEFADRIVRRMNTPSKGVPFDEALEG